MKTDRVIRAFDVLELLSGHAEGLRLTEINQALGVPLSSTHTPLRAMTEADLVVASGRRYRVGPRALLLNIRLVDGVTIKEAARRHLPTLVDEIGHDVYLAMRVGDDVIYVDHFESRRSVSITIRLGRRLHLHATSVGKLFAAFHTDLRARTLSGPLRMVASNTITKPEQLEMALDTIRKEGFSISHGEGVEGITGLAVPLHDPTGTVVAAIHISVVEAADADIHRLLAAAAATVKRVERDMGSLERGEAAMGSAVS